MSVGRGPTLKPASYQRGMSIWHTTTESYAFMCQVFWAMLLDRNMWRLSYWYLTPYVPSMIERERHKCPHLTAWRAPGESLVCQLASLSTNADQVILYTFIISFSGTAGLRSSGSTGWMGAATSGLSRQVKLDGKPARWLPAQSLRHPACSRFEAMGGFFHRNLVPLHTPQALTRPRRKHAFQAGAHCVHRAGCIPVSCLCLRSKYHPSLSPSL